MSDPQLQFEFGGDTGERERVLDPKRSFIVQAPAGSGKTELLMQRYLTLLAHESVQEPESVLAITFTRKAAAEMRNRVIEALRQSSEAQPEEAHRKLSWELAKRVMVRDQALGWGILDNPERLEIRTVDSFCEKIANRTPLLAGLGQAPAIAGDFEPLYAEAAERTLLMLGDPDAENRTAVAQVLRDQDNNLERVQRLIVDLLRRRDQWLRVIGGSLQRTAEEQSVIRVRLEQALQDAIRYELRSLREKIRAVVPENVLSELIDLARYAAQNVQRGDKLETLLELRDLPGTSLDDLPRWQAFNHFCLTGKKFRRQYDARMGFPAAPHHRRHKERCLELVTGVAEDACAEDFAAALYRITKLPPPDYRDEQWASLLAIFRVLPLSVANLRTVFAERGEVDHTEIALAAKSALGEEDHPTDLALHLGYKIQHLLVDEFQDTSVSQAELLERLIQTWSPDSGATLFVVGDPMQSIYAFRQAEVTLFQRAREHGFGNGEWPLEPAQLVANFRSRPELVNWFNQEFPQILTTDSDVSGAVKYAYSEAAKPSSKESCVEFHSAPWRDFPAEAEQVVQIVRGELKKSVAGSIAILARSRRHVAHIAPALREAGIPFRAKEIDPLAERQTVQDLHAITKALSHLADRTAWLTLLRGPWCGMSLADLWELCRGGDEQTIWELMQSRKDRFSPRGQKMIERILPVLAAAIDQRGRMPLRALVASVWISLGGPAVFYGAEHDAKVRDAAAYLQLLQEIEGNGEVDALRLEREIEKLHAPGNTASGIRVEIMTIHGAKGLEFDTVILPGLNRRTASNRTQLLNWRERVIGDHRDLLLAPMEPVGTDQNQLTATSKYILQLGQECSLEESKRLLYVAVTRARERLHLVTTMPDEGKDPETGSLFALLPPEVIARFPAQKKVLEEDTEEARKPNKLRRLRETWTIPAPPAPIVFEPRFPVSAVEVERKHTFVRVGEDLRRIGTVTHRILQQIGEEGLDAWPQARISKLAPIVRAMLMQEGVQQQALNAAEKRVRDALRNTLADQQGRWILQRRASFRNEYALTATLAGTRHSIKVDRTFVEGEIRWLIDYKTSDQEGTITDTYLQEQIEKYRTDLERYARVLHALDGLPLKGGLYFPLLQRWCEVDLNR